MQRSINNKQIPVHCCEINNGNDITKPQRIIKICVYETIPNF